MFLSDFMERNEARHNVCANTCVLSVKQKQNPKPQQNPQKNKTPVPREFITGSIFMAALDIT